MDRPPWLVRIRRSVGGPVQGAGFLVTGDHLITCAHVVAHRPAASPPGEPVYVEFPTALGHDPIPCRVLADGWSPDEAYDVAVLELGGPKPAGVEPAPLRSTRGTRAGSEVVTVGFPRGHDTGVTARAVVVGFAAGHPGQIEMQATSVIGRAITPGFSGTPVWDERRECVIGMVLSRDLQEELRAAQALPVQEIAGRWPPLAGLVDVGFDRVQRDRLGGLLAVPPGADGGFPRVREVAMHRLGVQSSKQDAARLPTPYVARPKADRELAEALGRSSFLLLVGDSTTGKSRTMAELLRREWPDARLIVPAGEKAGLDELTREPLPTGGDRGVLWLDDLARYIGPNGVDTTMLERLAQHDPPITVVATITWARWGELDQAPGEVRRTAQAIWQRAGRVELARRLTPEERAAAEGLYPGEDFSEYGIGEQLMAAPQLADRYAGAAEAHPSGWAVLHATVDWRRTGLDRPVPRRLLRELYGRYLAEHAAPVTDTDEGFEAGLLWALQPVAGSVALLGQAATAGGPGFRVSDYLIELADGQRGPDRVPVLDAAWDLALRAAEPAELLAVGLAAVVRAKGELSGQAILRAYDSAPDSTIKAWAALLLGELAYGKGALAEAGPYFEEAMRGPAADVTRFAQLNLGVVRWQQGELAAAEQLFTPLLEAGESDASDLARAHLGGMLAGRPEPGRSRPNRSAAEPAARSGGDGELALGLRTVVGLDLRREGLVPFTQMNLGGLLLDQGQLDRAEDLLERALAANNPAVRPLAQANLGMLLLNKGGTARALELLESAAGSAQPMAALAAMTTLGAYHGTVGELDRSRDLLTRVVEAGSPEQTPRAADLLGDLLVAEGDVAGAEAAYRRAIEGGHYEWSPIAMIDLAGLLEQRGDSAGARAMLVRVGESRNRYQALRGTGLLGDLLAAEGDFTGAEAAYRRLIDERHPFWEPVGRMAMGILRLADDDRVAAADWLTQATLSGNEPAARRAHLYLGLMDVDDGEAERAREQFRRAAEAADPEVRDVARYHLARQAAADGDLAEAERLLRAVLDDSDAADTMVVPVVRAYLSTVLLLQGRDEEAADESARSFFERGDYLLEVGEVDAAAEWLSRAIDAGDPEVLPAARCSLGQVRLAQGRLAEAEQLLRHAVDSPVDAAARRYLGGVLARQERYAEAERILGPVADADSEHRPAALRLLGQLAAIGGRPAAARELLLGAIDAGDDEVALRSRLDLGELLAEQARPGEAAEILGPLAEMHGDLGRQARQALATARRPSAVEAARGSESSGPAVGEAARGREPSGPPAVEAPGPPEPRTPEPLLLPPAVMLLLGEVAEAEGDPGEARWWLRELATQPPEPDVADRAARLLALLGGEKGE
jgi:tetratricopeptide (TPR) repeat protein